LLRQPLRQQQRCGQHHWRLFDPDAALLWSHLECAPPLESCGDPVYPLEVLEPFLRLVLQELGPALLHLPFLPRELVHIVASYACAPPRPSLQLCAVYDEGTIHSVSDLHAHLDEEWAWDDADAADTDAEHDEKGEGEIGAYRDGSLMDAIEAVWADIDDATRALVLKQAAVAPCNSATLLLRTLADLRRRRRDDDDALPPALGTLLDKPVSSWLLRCSDRRATLFARGAMAMFAAWIGPDAITGMHVVLHEAARGQQRLLTSAQFLREFQRHHPAPLTAEQVQRACDFPPPFRAWGYGRPAEGEQSQDASESDEA